MGRKGGRGSNTQPALPLRRDRGLILLQDDTDNRIRGQGPAAPGLRKSFGAIAQSLCEPKRRYDKNLILAKLLSADRLEVMLPLPRFQSFVLPETKQETNSHCSANFARSQIWPNCRGNGGKSTRERERERERSSARALERASERASERERESKSIEECERSREQK